ncbi:protein immune deficiency [Anabrus simplex]|uniref:protein immune deficiency n=1 Tax=Anabrus simplex TaxID=316456 RepID=UPI0035A390E6
MSMQDTSDQLTTDSVPEPPRENSGVEPPKENASYNHVKSGMKEDKNEKKKKETKEKSSKKSKTPPKKPEFPYPFAVPTTTVNITGNRVQLGNVINITVNPQTSKPSPERMEKPVEKPKAVAELIKSSDTATEDDLDIVACHVGYGWKSLGKKLGFSEGQLEQFEENRERDKADFKEMVYQMLLDWKQSKDNKATVGILCHSLWKTRQYDAAVYLAKERSS